VTITGTEACEAMRPHQHRADRGQPAGRADMVGEMIAGHVTLSAAGARLAALTDGAGPDVRQVRIGRVRA
jgi:hypothetical protein